MPELELTPRIYFAFICIFILWGVSSYLICFDLATVPKRGSAGFYEMYPDWYEGEPYFPDPDRVWEWDIGNGFVSNIEHVVMVLFGFFGFMRFLDLMKLFAQEERRQSWRMFWELCEC